MEFDLGEFLRFLGRRLRLPLLGLVVGGLVGGLLGFFLPPAMEYQAIATSTVLPADTLEEVEFTDLLSVLRELAVSEESYQAVRRRWPEEVTLPQLRRVLTLSLQGNLVTVTATGKTREDTLALSLLGQEVLQERLPTLFPLVTLSPQPATVSPLATLTGDTPLKRGLRFALLSGGGVLTVMLFLSFLFEVTERRKP